MANSKPKKNPQTKPSDIEKIKSDVASFASSLGLSSSLPNSDFNDTDFRKTGSLKPNRTPKPYNPKQIQEKTQFNSKKLEHQKPNSNSTLINNKNGRSSGDISCNNGDYRSFGRFQNLPKLPLMKANNLGVWYADESELEEKVMGGGERKRVVIGNADEWKGLVEKKKEIGERLLAQYTVEYEASRGQSGDIKMLIATQRSGTAADKVSAYSVLVADNPIANLRSLDALLAMVTSKVGKRHALTGFEALKELFIQSLLPDRKLKTLFQRPLEDLPETKDGYSLLLFWYWEECLKSRYERFVSALEEASRDMLPILKDKALKAIYVLLRSKSEQERRLLSALVNKLGDPENKAASSADFHLSNLLSDHPNMKVVVIDEVDSFLFRPHLGLRAKYHAVNFLSQIRLSHKGNGPKVAKRLIDVYFALFKVLISEAGTGLKTNENKETDSKNPSSKDSKAKSSSESHVELDSRLLSALLTGVNRAFPFVSTDEADEIVEVQTPMLFQLVHSKNFNIGIQALMLLDKISTKNQIVSDRFYRALYSKLLLPAAMISSKAEMFIGLLLRAMKNDINIKRVAAFSKRLLQVALQQPPQYACGCLFLLSEVLKARPPLWNMVLQNESVDEELEHFEDVPDETNDQPVTDIEELKAEASVPRTDSGVDIDRDSSQDEEAPSASSTEDDASDDAEDFIPGKSFEEPPESKSNDKLFDHSGSQHLESFTKASLPGGYDPRHREPSYCNADRASWWELLALASHAHPSVSTMAMTLLSGANIVYNGNPLNDLSLIAFLDKFMEKKPKQSMWHGGSQIEPSKKLDMSNHLIGPEILSLAEEDVPPEDLVFHKFYMNKMDSSKKPKKKKKKKGAEEVAAEDLYGYDESDNEEIENMLDAAEPAIDDADGDYDYDDLDKVADDDDDLIGDASDVEKEIPSDIEGADDDVAADLEGDGSDSDSDSAINVGDIDDGSDADYDEVGAHTNKKRKRKSVKRTSASPFASLEEYEHLLKDDDDDEDNTAEKKTGRKIRPKLRKKKCSK
ncbi:auxilin-like clathrin-binding protein required for normal clathrin function [Ancistrocladus abbreviatus]